MVHRRRRRRGDRRRADPNAARGRVDRRRQQVQTLRLVLLQSPCPRTASSPRCSSCPHGTSSFSLWSCSPTTRNCRPHRWRCRSSRVTVATAIPASPQRRKAEGLHAWKRGDPDAQLPRPDPHLSHLSPPFAIWMLVGYLDSIPRELEQATYVDGCGPIGALFKVVIPTAMPGIVAVASWRGPSSSRSRCWSASSPSSASSSAA